MKVALSINQITDGIEYDGKFTIRDVEFVYELRFGVPINQLTNQKPPTRKEDMPAYARRMFNITLRRGTSPMQVDDKTFGFLVSLVGSFAIEFYNNEQTRDSNEGPLKPLAEQLGGKVSFGMETHVDVPDEHIPPLLLAA